MTLGTALFLVFILLYILNRWVLPLYWGRFDPQ